ARLVQEAVHPEANIIFGATIEDTLGDEVRITVIAAGFDGGEPKHRKFECAMIGSQEQVLETEAVIEPEVVEPVEVEAPSFEAEEELQPAQASKPSSTGSFGDDLDLPEFFR
ncbi:MAG: cell division protein FtsZ, partial [Aquiluna sp.]